MRRLLLALLLLLCTHSVLALEVIPAAVDSHTYVRMRITTTACVPVTNVAVSGSTITITVTELPGFGCIAALYAPTAAIANVGVLAPGVYEVVAGSDRSTLIVRDAETGILVSPVGLAAGSGRTVQVFSGRPLDSRATVLFDGIPAQIVSFTSEQMVVTPPPHAPGTVDVTLNDALGTRKAVAAFTYFDPSATPDPQVFEPVLFPIAYDGAGIFGSQWTTENAIGTGDTLVRFRQPVPVRSCSGGCSQLNWSAALATESDSGVLLWVVRRRLPEGVDDEFHVASRVADISRPRGGGTSLPVGREDDFGRSVSIADIPLDGGDRTLLRIYAVGSLASASVRMELPDGTTTFHTVALRAADGFSYGTLDFAPLPLRGAGRAAVTVSATEKVWALVTVTDNETQEVTALWPR